jgi:hypothetical protein
MFGAVLLWPFFGADYTADWSGRVMRAKALRSVKGHVSFQLTLVIKWGT